MSERTSGNGTKWYYCKYYFISFSPSQSFAELDSLELEMFEDTTEKLEIIYRDMLKKDASPLGERWVFRDFIVGNSHNLQTDTIKQSIFWSMHIQWGYICYMNH